MKEKKIIITSENENLKYEIQGENISGGEVMEMLFMTIMAVNEDINKGASEIERYKSKKALKEILSSIFDEGVRKEREE